MKGGQPVPFSHTIIGATQAALWLESNDDPLWLDLFDSVSDPAHETADPVLKLAISMTASLIAPSSGMTEWLNCPEKLQGMCALVEALQEFTILGLPFLQNHLNQAAELFDPEEFDLLSSKAAKWLEDAPNWKTNLTGANEVWRDLVGHQGAIRALVEPVANKDRKSVVRLRAAVREWQATSKVEKKINHLFQTTRSYSLGDRNSRIFGGRMEKMVKQVQGAVELALRWCDLVDIERSLNSTHAEGEAERTHRLLQQVKDALPATEEALASFAPESLRDIAAVHCLRRSLEKLCLLLKISDVSPDGNVFCARRKPLSELVSSLSRRLLWCPELELDEEGKPDSLGAVCESLRDSCAAGTTLDSAWPEWIRTGDFRSVEALLSEMPTPERQNHYQAALDRARRVLAKQKAELSEAVEQALMDGALAEEYSEFTVVLESIEPERLLNLRPAAAKLRDLSVRLAKAGTDRLSHLQEKWRGLEPRLRSHPGLVQAESESLSAFIENAIAEKDLRVIDECLAGIDQIFESDKEMSDILTNLPWRYGSVERDILTEYLGVIANLEDWLHSKTDQLANFQREVLKGQNQFQNFGLPGVPQNRRNEVVETIASWLHMQAGSPRSGNLNEHLWTILRFLGFQSLAEANTPITLIKASTDWLLARANVLVGKSAEPIWQLGSECKDNDGKGSYSVLCFWGSPSVRKVEQCLRQVTFSDTGLLIIYLGYLTGQQRAELASLSRMREPLLAHALLDENLLIFLSSESDDRLPAFFRCSMPFSAASPYTPQRRGDTPEEMFFGREKLVSEIWKPSGSCILYGGRQLGKSALLQQVARLYHRPDQWHYVFIKTLGEKFGSGPSQTTEAIWSELRILFQDAGLWGQRKRTDDIKTISRDIQDLMKKEVDLSVLVLFDEADDFLDADADNNFRALLPLRDLMTNTNRRFKTVFAGNRHVQRFQDWPDQPFLQFGKPQMVGPLDPGAARDLVRKPQEALGYRLDEPTVLRILSYTNYHAVLIHVFCAALIKRLRKVQGVSLPPYEIQRDDVEAVNLDPEVRKEISDQFKATLVLDDDYKVITWLMIQHQMSARDSYGATYTAGEILDLARDGWPLGFQSYNLGLMKVRLEEMCGLGLLVRLKGTVVNDLDGQYKLRSPNLVRMMGTEDVIKRYLEEQRDKPRETKNDQDRHAWWGGKNSGINGFSPLTIAQERSLNLRQTGVGLIFSSEALGLSSLPDVFHRLIPENQPDDIKAEGAEIPASVTDALGLEAWLRGFVEARPNHERLISYQRISEGVEDLGDYITAARVFCDVRYKKTRWLRLLFILDPVAMWRWSALPQDVRNRLETQVDSPIQACHWNLPGIRQMVSQSGKLYTDEVCRYLLEKTGGWPFLLQTVFQDGGEENDLRKVAKDIPERLKSISDSDNLASRFWEALGLKYWSIAQKVLRQIKSLKEVPVDLFVPEIFDGLEAGECQRSLDFLLRLKCVKQVEDTVHLDPFVNFLPLAILAPKEEAAPAAIPLISDN